MTAFVIHRGRSRHRVTYLASSIAILAGTIGTAISLYYHSQTGNR
jgi:hypothetical protein